VVESNGLLDCQPQGTKRTNEGVTDIDFARSKELSAEVNMAVPIGETQWNPSYPEDKTAK
jgi:Mn-containing catalase